MRLIRYTMDGQEILILTDLNLETILIALIYRYRWQAECRTLLPL